MCGRIIDKQIFFFCEYCIICLDNYHEQLDSKMPYGSYSGGNADGENGGYRSGYGGASRGG